MGLKIAFHFGYSVTFGVVLLPLCFYELLRCSVVLIQRL